MPSPRLPIDRPPNPILIEPSSPKIVEAPANSINPFAASVRPEDRASVELRLTPPTPSQAPDHAPATRRRVSKRRLLGRGLVAAAFVGIGIGGAWISRHESTKQDRVVVTKKASSPSIKNAENGDPVRWHNDAVDVVLDDSLSTITPDAPAVYAAAVDAWRASGAVLPSVSTISGTARRAGYSNSGPNENVVLFAPYGWSKASGALAITVVTFDSISGAMVDADLVVNGGGRFFSELDTTDDNAEDGDAVSIEGDSNGTDVEGKKDHKKVRFDLQSVLTHELGHFFGLGEDYDESRATMYVTTKAGETHKRVLAATDASAITALYVEGLQHASAKAGCGGAHLARGGHAAGSGTSQAWLGFALAGLGLGLLAAGRRQRAAPVPVPIDRATSQRRLARMRQIGGWFTAAGLVSALSPPAVSMASPGEAHQRGDAEVEVVAARPHWEDGVVQTELTLRVATCHIGTCPEGEQKLVVMGGKMGRVTQVVGPYAVPDLGARVQVSLRGARGLIDRLSPALKTH